MFILKFSLQVVRWGRSVYANIQKFIQFQLTVNVAALVINVVAAVSSGDVPLNAVEVIFLLTCRITILFLLLNFFYWSGLACHVHEKGYDKSLLSIRNIGCILFITGIGIQIITRDFFFLENIGKHLI